MLMMLSVGTQLWQQQIKQHVHILATAWWWLLFAAETCNCYCICYNKSCVSSDYVIIPVCFTIKTGIWKIHKNFDLMSNTWPILIATGLRKCNGTLHTVTCHLVKRMRTSGTLPPLPVRLRCVHRSKFTFMELRLLRIMLIQRQTLLRRMKFVSGIQISATRAGRQRSVLLRFNFCTLLST
jgi:hypothetical protein